MFHVIHSGWLLILLCVGVLLLLAACASFSIRTPVQNMTHTPLVTLTIVPFATAAPQFSVTVPAPETQIALPPPEWIGTRLSLASTRNEDPACFSSPNQEYTCLGQVWNQTAETLSNITVRVSLFNNRGQILSEQIIGIEQHYLPPETAAPYRAQFKEINTNSDFARAEIAASRVVDAPPQPIQITGERGVMAETGRYVVTTNLYNTSEHMAERIRLIVTLLDANEQVVGYRVHSPLPIAAGTQQAVRLEIIPQVIESEIHHLLHVEALHDGD